MRACRSGGVALVIAIAVSLSGASVALAAAEFSPIPANRGFETRSGISVLTGGGGSEKITCTASRSSGEITGATTVGKVLVVYTGCTSAGIGGQGCPVESYGAAKAGEISTKVLKGELGTAAAGEAPSERVLVIRPESGKKFAVVEGNRCTEEATVTGSIAGEVERVGISSVKNGLIFKVIGGKQAIRRVKVGSEELMPELIAFAGAATESAGQEWEFRESVEIT
jgi:hypothetical protein